MARSSANSQAVMRRIVKHYAFGERIKLDYIGESTIGLPKDILKTQKQNATMLIRFITFIMVIQIST